MRKRVVKQAMSKPIETSSNSFVTGGDVSRFQPKNTGANDAAAAANTMAKMLPSIIPKPSAGGVLTPASRALVAPGTTVRVTRGKDTENVSVWSN